MSYSKCFMLKLMTHNLVGLLHINVAPVGHLNLTDKLVDLQHKGEPNWASSTVQ